MVIKISKEFPTERMEQINTAIQYFKFYRIIMRHSEDKARKLVLRYILEKEDEMALARSR